MYRHPRKEAAKMDRFSICKNPRCRFVLDRSVLGQLQKNPPSLSNCPASEGTWPNARPISCSDCPAFQRHHMSLFSIAESPNRFPSTIDTTFSEKIYIRWCCIDLLRSPLLLVI